MFFFSWSEDFLLSPEAKRPRGSYQPWDASVVVLQSLATTLPFGPSSRFAGGAASRAPSSAGAGGVAGVVASAAGGAGAPSSAQCPLY